MKTTENKNPEALKARILDLLATERALDEEYERLCYYERCPEFDGNPEGRFRAQSSLETQMSRVSLKAWRLAKELREIDHDAWASLPEEIRR